MKTYQDLLKLSENELERMLFCIAAIAEHMGSKKYKLAKDADDYYKNQNPNILRVQKYITNAMGKSVPDTFSPNNKIPSNMYHYFVTQEVQTLLGNGASFGNDKTKEKLGKKFDKQLQEMAKNAINGGVSFGFWNYDHIEVFSILEFVPLYDEYTGDLMAGIRFWQIDSDKPLCIVLFEPDGLTEYIRESGKDMQVTIPKRSYKMVKLASKADGEFTADMGNYESLPIIPMYNENKMSAIVGKQNTLDAYDLTLSQMVNNVDDGNFIYWVLKNCGGMDSVDDEQFISQLKITHVAHADGDTGAEVEAHMVEAPYAANTSTLEKLRSQLFDDFMALDTKNIADGAVTATQILAAYEPLNNKCDQLEYNVIEFVEGVMAVAGINDSVSFTRSKVVNVSDEIQTLVLAANYLPEQYITEKVLHLLGDGDRMDEIMGQIEANDMGRFGLNDRGRADEEDNGGVQPSSEGDVDEG